MDRKYSGYSWNTENVIKELEEVLEYIKETKDTASKKSKMIDYVADAIAMLKEQRIEIKGLEHSVNEAFSNWGD